MSLINTFLFFYVHILVYFLFDYIIMVKTVIICEIYKSKVLDAILNYVTFLR